MVDRGLSIGDKGFRIRDQGLTIASYAPEAPDPLYAFLSEGIADGHEQQRQKQA
jgi:hypothetical protein